MGPFHKGYSILGLFEDLNPKPYTVNRVGLLGFGSFQAAHGTEIGFAVQRVLSSHQAWAITDIPAYLVLITLKIEKEQKNGVVFTQAVELRVYARRSGTEDSRRPC